MLFCSGVRSGVSPGQAGSRTEWRTEEPALKAVSPPEVQACEPVTFPFCLSQFELGAKTA